MSVVHERGALEPPISLFEHARRLHRSNPDAPLPNGGRPFPDRSEHARVPPKERRRAMADLLREFADDPSQSAQDLHDRCAHLAVEVRDVLNGLRSVAPGPSGRLLETARWLVENGTDRCAVLLGLGLFHGRAERRDVPLIKIIGLLCFADRPAVRVLAKIPGAARDVVWLAERSRRYPRMEAVTELAGDPDPAVRAWVLSTPRQLLSSELARRIAEEYDLAGTLGGPAVADVLWRQAGNLLIAMGDTREPEIDRYERARAAYDRWVALADRMTATLEGAALLVMAAQDLATGPAALAVGEARGGLLDRIRSVLSSPPWTGTLADSASSGDPVEARRAAWAVGETSRIGVPAERFAVRVVVPDPNPVGFPLVEARILVDGTPIVAAAFGRGPADSPEGLVHSGRLRALSEPREVRLAEAPCTEGCCGALYATIVREGPDVVWTYRRTSPPDEPSHEVRFDAEEYDRELTRAGRDHAWEWPARTLARLLADRLRTDPAILGRWDCAFSWSTAWLKDLDSARLTFRHPARRGSFEDPYIQFGLVIDVEGRDPEALAAEIIESLRTTDPKPTAEMIGGTRDGAERLGLTPRNPTRW